jgi:hypothetical protein
MSLKNVERTHCVTFTHNGDKFFAVKSRSYGDEMGEGISQPEVRCAMSLSQATRIANVAIGAGFSNVKVQALVIKPRKSRSNK